MKPDCDLAKLIFKPFGSERSDLDFNFETELRPQLVTRILKSHVFFSDGRAVSEVELWDLTLTQRVLWLIALSTFESAFQFKIKISCTSQTCKKLMEVNLSLQELVDLDPQLGLSELSMQLDGMTVRIRKPKGKNQISWQEKLKHEAGAMRRLPLREIMLRTLVDPPVSPDYYSRIEEVLEDFDPLLNLKLELNCPSCGKDQSAGVDLEQIALNRLKKAQCNLLNVIHRLARTYHWSESEIFRLPHWRRNHYLRLLTAEEQK